MGTSAPVTWPRSAPGAAVTIKGRKKDVIIRNGENISAKEIEDLLYEHPAVRGGGCSWAQCPDR